MRSTNQNQEYAKFFYYKIFYFSIYIDRAINMVPKNKAICCDITSGELYKDVKIEEELKLRLAEQFRSYITRNRSQLFYDSKTGIAQQKIIKSTLRSKI